MNNIERIIGEIEDYIEGCKTNPLNRSTIMVQKEEITALLLDLREAVPDEIRQCQKIISNQNAILTDARARADSMIQEAKQTTEQMVDEHEIMQQAYATANQYTENARLQAQAIVDQATDEANSIRLGAVQYTDSMLQTMQTILQHSMDGAQKNYEGLMMELKSNLEIITSNRNVLAQGVTTQEN